MRARFQLACLAACSLFLSSAFGDKAISCYSAPASGTVARGCVQVIFDFKNFTGTIGNATFTSFTSNPLMIQTVGNGTSLSAIPYTMTSAADSLVICEVR